MTATPSRVGRRDDAQLGAGLALQALGQRHIEAPIGEDQARRDPVEPGSADVDATHRHAQIDVRQTAEARKRDLSGRSEERSGSSIERRGDRPRKRGPPVGGHAQRHAAREMRSADGEFGVFEIHPSAGDESLAGEMEIRVGQPGRPAHASQRAENMSQRWQARLQSAGRDKVRRFDETPAIVEPIFAQHRVDRDRASLHCASRPARLGPTDVQLRDLAGDQALEMREEIAPALRQRHQARETFHREGNDLRPFERMTSRERSSPMPGQPIARPIRGGDRLHESRASAIRRGEEPHSAWPEPDVDLRAIRDRDG